VMNAPSITATITSRLMRISSIPSTRRWAAGLYQSLRRLPSAQRTPAGAYDFAVASREPCACEKSCR